jgi:hypothetical protein
MKSGLELLEKEGYDSEITNWIFEWEARLSDSGVVENRGRTDENSMAKSFLLSA